LHRHETYTIRCDTLCKERLTLARLFITPSFLTIPTKLMYSLLLSLIVAVSLASSVTSTPTPQPSKNTLKFSRRIVARGAESISQRNRARLQELKARANGLSNRDTSVPVAMGSELVCGRGPCLSRVVLTRIPLIVILLSQRHCRHASGACV
jgi:hypothetical protein